MTDYELYLKALRAPYFAKRAKLEFLQPDGSVAFALNNVQKRGYMSAHDSRAFLQSGSVNIALQNGQRRTASVTLANVDDAFSYNVNKVWFGKAVRLSMGLELPDGRDFYLPQGVFYIKQPNTQINTNTRTITYSLSDKWSYLNGDMLGTLDHTYQVNTGTNIFSAITSILRLSKIDQNETADVTMQIDNAVPIYTDYYDGKTYSATNSDGTITSDIAMNTTPYTITKNGGSTFADIILELNTAIAGLIGYDQTGALRIDPSQDDVTDNEKPLLWDFSLMDNKAFSLQETIKNTEVFNDILIVGEGDTSKAVWGRASNFDPSSDTNINLIGRRLYREAKSTYWNTAQCLALAEWYLKRKTILQKSISFECQQMFHLYENGTIKIKRTDKIGSPIEKHVIQSLSIPIAEIGAMTITAVSVNDYPIATTSQSS